MVKRRPKKGDRLRKRKDGSRERVLILTDVPSLGQCLRDALAGWLPAEFVVARPETPSGTDRYDRVLVYLSEAVPYPHEMLIRLGGRTDRLFGYISGGRETIAKAPARDDVTSGRIIGQFHAVCRRAGCVDERSSAATLNGRIQELEVRLREEDTNPGIMRRLASELHALGDPERALDLLSKAYQLAPTNREIALELARVHVDLANAQQSDEKGTGRALEHYERARRVTLATKNGRGDQERAIIGRTYQGEARLRNRHENLAQAGRFLEEALRLQKSVGERPSVDLLNDLVGVYVDLDTRDSLRKAGELCELIHREYLRTSPADAGERGGFSEHNGTSTVCLTHPQQQFMTGRHVIKFTTGARAATELRNFSALKDREGTLTTLKGMQICLPDSMTRLPANEADEGILVWPCLPFKSLYDALLNNQGTDEMSVGKRLAIAEVLVDMAATLHTLGGTYLSLRDHRNERFSRQDGRISCGMYTSKIMRLVDELRALKREVSSRDELGLATTLERLVNEPLVSGPEWIHGWASDMHPDNALEGGPKAAEKVVGRVDFAADSRRNGLSDVQMVIGHELMGFNPSMQKYLACRYLAQKVVYALREGGEKQQREAEKLLRSLPASYWGRNRSDFFTTLYHAAQQLNYSRNQFEVDCRAASLERHAVLATIQAQRIRDLGQHVRTLKLEHPLLSGFETEQIDALGKDGGTRGVLPSQDSEVRTTAVIYHDYTRSMAMVLQLQQFLNGHIGQLERAAKGFENKQLYERLSRVGILGLPDAIYDHLRELKIL